MHNSTIELNSELREALDFNTRLAERVNREAHDATRMPRWFSEVAAIVVVLTLICSAIWPWGFAA